MSKKKNIEIDKRSSAFVTLKDFCSFAKPADYVEVCEWTNKAGYDIDISRDTNLGSIRIQLTYGELDAIIACYKKLSKIE